MKNLAFLIILSLIFCTNEAISKDKKNKNNESSAEIKFKQTIIQKIKYPSFASEQKLEGDVVVSFVVNKDGRINVIESNASDNRLKDYVIEKLNEISYPIEDVMNGKIYNMKFSFRLY